MSDKGKDASAKRDLHQNKTSTEIKIQVLLTEYTALREEILLCLDQTQKLFVWVGAAIYVVFAFLLTNTLKFPEIRILYIFFPFILFAWTGFALKPFFKMHQISCYLELVGKKIDCLLDSSLMKWENIADISFRKGKAYLRISSFYLHFLKYVPFLFVLVYSYVEGLRFLSELKHQTCESYINKNPYLVDTFKFGIPFTFILLMTSIIFYFIRNIRWLKCLCEKEFKEFKKKKINSKS